MISLRFHGRGGQGVVKACQILAKALISDGKYAQFIPAFGVERKGSPVYGYFRIDDREIRPKCQVYFPDGIIVFDDSLLEEPNVNVYEGITEGAFAIFNTRKSLNELQLPDVVKRVAVLDANAIADECLGRVIPNTAMLGALAKLVQTDNADAISGFVLKKFGKENQEAFLKAYEKTGIIERQGSR